MKNENSNIYPKVVASFNGLEENDKIPSNAYFKLALKLNDDLQEVADELVKCDALERSYIGLDYFDASITLFMYASLFQVSSSLFIIFTSPPSSQRNTGISYSAAQPTTFLP